MLRSLSGKFKNVTGANGDGRQLTEINEALKWKGCFVDCRPAIQRSGLGRDRPGCPAVARLRVGGRDSKQKGGRAKPSKSQARLLSRWTWQCEFIASPGDWFLSWNCILASRLNDECADAYFVQRDLPRTVFGEAVKLFVFTATSRPFRKRP